MLHAQEAGPRDAEVKRGKKKAYTRKQRYERKLLLPGGCRWFPKEEPGTILAWGTENSAGSVPEVRGEQEGRIAQNELLSVLRKVNGRLDLRHRHRKHLGIRKASSIVFAMDCIPNSFIQSQGFQLLGCMCSLHIALYLCH